MNDELVGRGGQNEGRGPVLEVTEEALAALATCLDVSGAGPGQGLRLARAGRGEFSLEIDKLREGDRVVRYGERPVLLIDQEVSVLLEEAILEVLRSPEGAHLTLRLPEGG